MEKGTKIILCIVLAVLTAVSFFLLALTVILLFAASYSLYLLPASGVGGLAAVAVAFGIGCQALIRCVKTWYDLFESAEPQETRRQGKQPEFGEDGKEERASKFDEDRQEGKASEFDEAQEWEIQHGRDFGLSEEQLALYARPDFNCNQMRYVRYGLEGGLPVEQVKLYARPEFSAMQMQEILSGCGKNVSLEEIAGYAKPELTPLQIQERRKQLYLERYRLPQKNPAQE